MSGRAVSGGEQHEYDLLAERVDLLKDGSQEQPGVIHQEQPNSRRW